MSRGRRRILRAILAAPLSIRILVGAVLILALWSAVNWGYQVIRKPTELFFPVSGALAKTPPETWRRYGRLFREHSTAVITPDLLAALAQVEGRGNPVARTYWRWRLTWNPFQLYQPASSAVGMYQITDATFREAKRYCIHDHVVVEDGPWYDVRSSRLTGSDAALARARSTVRPGRRSRRRAGARCDSSRSGRARRSRTAARCHRPCRCPRSACRRWRRSVAPARAGTPAR